MNKEEKAVKLVEKFIPLVDGREDTETGFRFSKQYQLKMAKKCALICVREIELALTEYGKQSDELQNMDSEWRWIAEVKTEIENYHG